MHLRFTRITDIILMQIVEVVLRQGLVHPITCVPCLIALETDPLESNSKLAHHLLLNMNEKYSRPSSYTLFFFCFVLFIVIMNMIFPSLLLLLLLCIFANWSIILGTLRSSRVA